MPIDPYADIQQFERWFLGFATRPTVTSLVIIFVALATVTWWGRPWTPSTRAWFVFAVANAATWLYFREGTRLSADWQIHARFAIVWWLWLSGAWFAWTLFARFVRGAEDVPPPSPPTVERDDPPNTIYERRSETDRRAGWGKRA